MAISEPKALSASGSDPGCTSEACVKDITETANFRDANYEKASRDGSKVFFTSTQQLLNNATQDSNEEDSAAPRQEGNEQVKGCAHIPQVSGGTTGPNGCNLYEYDLEENPETKAPVGLSLVSGGDSSGLGPQVQGVAAVSEDGSHVYFVAKGVLTREPRAGASGECIAQLTPAERAVEESTNEGRCRPKQGAQNLYVHDTDTDETEFVATLAETDDVQWTFNAGGIVGKPMDVTDDGKFLVFTSTEHLVAGDASTVRQVFRYDAQTGALVRVSLGDEGQNGLGEGLLSRRASSPAKEQVDSDAHPAVSENGAYVVFASSEALVPGASSNECVSESEPGACNYAYNIYEYHEGHLYLISRDGSAVVISQSGRDIFFQTPESLVPQDTDTLPDLYDARIGGGFAVSGSVPCKEEACQGSVSAAPVFAAPVSATFSGSGNLTPPIPAAPKPKPRTSTRAQKLANALRTCRKRRSRTSRNSCEKEARRSYGLNPRPRNPIRIGGPHDELSYLYLIRSSPVPPISIRPSIVRSRTSFSGPRDRHVPGRNPGARLRDPLRNASDVSFT